MRQSGSLLGCWVRERKPGASCHWLLLLEQPEQKDLREFGAERGTRTLTLLPTADFESAASTDSATSA